MKRFIAFIVVIITVSLLLINIVQAKSGSFKEVYDAKSKVNIETKIGSLVLATGSADQIIVECEYDMSRNMYIEPSVKVRKNYLKIKGELRGTRGNRFRGDVVWTISVPNNTEVEFSTTSGGVTIEDFKGDFDGNTASGSIELTNCEGFIIFNTASGSIDLDNCNGDFELNTASGKISATDSKGSFNLNSASGEVYADGVILEDESEFSSASGDVFVQLGKTTDFDLTVSTASGDATLDYNGNDVVGYVELSSNDRKGNIVCPFDFDDVRYERQGGYGTSKRVIKSFIKGEDTPFIEIGTASGRATLID